MQGRQTAAGALVMRVAPAAAVRRIGAVLAAALVAGLAPGLVAAAPVSAAPAHAMTPAASDPSAAPVASRGPVGTVGDAIPEPLHGLRGDAQRGRALVVDRRVGLCLLCHSGPFPEERTPGNLSTDLAGAGARWSEGQLRLRIVDPRRLNPDTLMPPYHRVDGLHRVGEAWRDRPLFTAQQVEDVVAFLMTLK